MKLALGTAQFGLDYGVNNVKGKIPKKEVFEILKCSLCNGIDTLDTAYAYGDSERIIGEFNRENGANFKVVSKLPSCDLNEVEKLFAESLKRLNLDKIYGYLIHNFKSFSKNTQTWNVLKQLRTQGIVEKIGFSLYYPEEIEYLLENKIQVNIVQVPFSIFDQRFSQILPQLKERNIEVYVRSVFLQGLVFKSPDELRANFTKKKDKLLFLQSIAQEMNIPLSAICINFALLNNYIEKVVVGVDGIEHLQEDIRALTHQNAVENIYDKLIGLRENNESMILPTNWS